MVLEIWDKSLLQTIAEAHFLNFFTQIIGIDTKTFFVGLVLVSLIYIAIKGGFEKAFYSTNFIMPLAIAFAYWIWGTEALAVVKILLPIWLVSDVTFILFLKKL